MPQALQTAPVFQNRLLAVLPREELERLALHFQHVPLVFRQTLYEAGAISEFVYFPLNGIISIIAVMKDGSSTEVGVVGKEGATDVSVVLGDDISGHRAIVQLGGSAMRLSAVVLREELRRDGELRSVLLCPRRPLLSTARRQTPRDRR